MGTADATVLAGRYELVALLGGGGSGSVYHARDRERREPVAVKILKKELVSRPEMLERFRTELRLARKVTDPHVVQTYEIGEHEGERFLTMELVEGESLAGQLDREPRLAEPRAVRIGLAILAGLAAAHDVGVIHGDLKPANVLVARDGSIKITDFGLARARRSVRTRSSLELSGTPAYMAPEQITADADLDARADVYAFGALLYEMLTGAPPWTGETALAIAMQRLLAEPPNPHAIAPEVTPVLAELVVQCMARRREDRPRDAREVAKALLAAELGPETPPAPRVFGAPSERTLKRVAVLPLRNLGPPADDYLVDGLTGELVEGLSVSRRLRVHSRASVMRFKGVQRDVREIGREIGVQALVDGAIERIGTDRLRVTLTLVSVADGFEIWRRSVELPVGDILSAGADAAAEIAEALAAEPTEPRRPQPIDATALDFYLRSRHAYHEFSVEGVSRALELIENARSRAPDDATIAAGHAMVLLRMLSVGAATDASLFEVAARTAERAVALRPNLGEAHVALATARMHACHWVGAATSARRAVEIAPSNAEAHVMLARLLLESGEVDEARAHNAISMEIDGRLELARMDALGLHALVGEWEEARTLALLLCTEHATTIPWVMALRFIGMWGRDDDTVSVVRERFAGSPLQSDGVVRAMFSVIDELEPMKFIGYLRRILRGPANSRRNELTAMQIEADVFAFVGRHAEAFAAIERAAALGLLDVLWLDRCPLLDVARRDPRFPAIRARVAERAAEVRAALA